MLKKILTILFFMLYLTSCSENATYLNPSNISNTINPQNITPDAPNISTNEVLEKTEDESILYEEVLYVGALFDFDLDKFINNPHDIAEYRSCREDRYTYQIIDSKKTMIDSPYYFPNEPNEYQQEAIWFLCDEESIKACFFENGIDEIKYILIFEMVSESTGFAIAAITRDSVFFMTVPMEREKYGYYEYKKVFTAKEFYELYQPKEAKLFVNGQEVQCTVAPILGDVIISMELFPLLDALNCEYVYDRELNTITFSNFSMKIIEKEHCDSAMYGTIYWKDETKTEFLPYGTFKYVNTSLIINVEAVWRLEKYLSFDMELKYDDYTIHIAD